MDSHDAEDASASGALRILVIDDNPDITDSLAMLLEILGHRPATQNDGLAALAYLAEQPMDVCLLDIGMPGMDGLELARQIRASLPPPQPELVAMTGFGAALDRERALQAGFDHYLVKPLNTGMLTALLQGIAAARAA